jgi:hypothetical protein
MADYNTNFMTAMTGHYDPGIKESKKEDDNGGGNNNVHQRGKYDDMLDTRDMLSRMIATGDVDRKSETFKQEYSWFVEQYGAATARNLINHVMLFNQDKSVKNLPWEAKLQKFYEGKSSNDQINEILSTSKGLGYGPVEGFRQTPYAPTHEFLGKINFKDVKSNPASLQQAKEFYSNATKNQ